MQFLKDKVMSMDDLAHKISLWRFKDDRIVFTNGCFDLLHFGHIHLLGTAASLGDRLIVGLNSDSSVRMLKGTDRPVQSEGDRAEILAALHVVDAIILFEEETPKDLIEMIAPDVLVKGGDYKREDIVGADFVIENGGELHIVPLQEGRSTSLILSKKP